MILYHTPADTLVKIMIVIVRLKLISETSRIYYKNLWKLEGNIVIQRGYL